MNNAHEPKMRVKSFITPVKAKLTKTNADQRLHINTIRVT